MGYTEPEKTEQRLLGCHFSPLLLLFPVYKTSMVLVIKQIEFCFEFSLPVTHFSLGFHMFNNMR